MASKPDAVYWRSKADQTLEKARLYCTERERHKIIGVAKEYEKIACRMETAGAPTIYK